MHPHQAQLVNHSTRAGQIQQSHPLLQPWLKKDGTQQTFPLVDRIIIGLQTYNSLQPTENEYVLPRPSFIMNDLSRIWISSLSELRESTLNTNSDFYRILKAPGKIHWRSHLFDLILSGRDIHESYNQDLVRQLAAAVDKQADYERRNATRLEEARRKREEENARRETERKEAEERAEEERKKLREERERLAEEDRLLIERRLEEDKARDDDKDL